MKHSNPRHRRRASLTLTPPPPGWTREADIAEEMLALSELTLMRVLRQAGDS